MRRAECRHHLYPGRLDCRASERSDLRPLDQSRLAEGVDFTRVACDEAGDPYRFQSKKRRRNRRASALSTAAGSSPRITTTASSGMGPLRILGTASGIAEFCQRPHQGPVSRRQTQRTAPTHEVSGHSRRPLRRGHHRTARPQEWAGHQWIRTVRVSKCGWCSPPGQHWRAALRSTCSSASAG